MTNSLGQYRQRKSIMGAAIALGCHPADPAAVASFQRDAFAELVREASVVGEVGLDGTGRLPLSEQMPVLDAIFGELHREPRIVSVHSAGARRPVLRALGEHRIAGVILHWWQGTRAETERAIELDCCFSICPRQLQRIDLSSLPQDRVLTETDHPYGGRTAGPGDVGAVERALAAAWRCDLDQVRAQLWSNFGRIARATGSWSLLPPAFRAYE